MEWEVGCGEFFGGEGEEVGGVARRVEMGMGMGKASESASTRVRW